MTSRKDAPAPADAEATGNNATVVTGPSAVAVPAAVELADGWRLEGDDLAALRAVAQDKFSQAQQRSQDAARDVEHWQTVLNELDKAGGK